MYFQHGRQKILGTRTMKGLYLARDRTEIANAIKRLSRFLGKATEEE